MRVTVNRSVLAILTCAAVALTGCGGSESPSPGAEQTSPGSVATTTITIKNFKYEPASITVSPGAKITVVNEDSAPHTVTSTGSEKFDTGRLAGAKTGSFTAPDAPGIYEYLCTIHEYMRGTVVVK